MAKSTKVSAKPKKAASKKATAKKVVKKAVKNVKPAKEERTINLKYSDKSAGQPELVKVFAAIKKLVEPYAGKGDLVLHGGTGGMLNLVSHKTVEIAGRIREELWFVSALVQKGYVGFYYMPVYMNEPVRKQIKPELLKCLKGKACFHIKKDDPLIYQQIKEALKAGYDDYHKKGWI